MYARIFYTDFSKGFDLVDHGALLHELEILKVHNAISRWIKAFLVDRRQMVKIDDHFSSDTSPRGGIPQGTKLAPFRRVATCKPGKPRLTSFSETLALFFVQFLSFRKMKVQDRQNGPSGLPEKTGWLRACHYYSRSL